MCVTKIHSLSVACLLAFLSPVFAQERELSTGLDAKVIGGISDGKPSPPLPPKVLPKYRINWTQVHQKNGQKIIVNQVQAPVPAMKPEVERMSDEELAQRSREFEKNLAESKPSGGVFMVFATIYDRHTTHLSWWHDGEKFEAYSNVDWNYLGGFASFEGRGKRYSMLLLSSNASVNKAERNHQRHKIPDLPKLPELANRGAAYMVVKGDESNDGAMEFMEAIHDLYEAEKPRLVAAYLEREKNRKIRAEKEAELRKDPPPKPDIIVNYWRKKTPLTPEQKGGTK